MEGGPPNVGARERPFEAPHLTFIKHALNGKPVFRLGFGNVKGETTVAYHCERSRKDVHNLREAFGMHPSSITWFFLCVATQFHAISRLLMPRADAKIALRAWGNKAYSEIPKKKARYFSVSDRTAVVGSGPGKSDVRIKELKIFHNLAASGLARNTSAICTTKRNDV